MAARKDMWFGTRDNMRWVPAPATGGDFSEVGWSASSQYLNGGGGVRSSFDSHKVYNMDWPAKPRDLLRPITDYASGLFGSDLIHFLDPMAADKNCLPQHWASPMLGGLDGVVLMGNKRPKLVDTPRNAFGLPVKGAEYSLDDTTNARSAYIPIPPNHTAWIDGRGSVEAVRVTPFSGSVPQGAPILPEMLEPTDQARFNTKIEGRGGVDGIEVAINDDPGEERVLARNLATNPSFEDGAGEVVVRENLAVDPGARNSPPKWTTRGGTESNPDAPTSRVAVSWSRSGYAYRVSGSSTSNHLNVEVSTRSSDGAFYPVSSGQILAASITVASSRSRGVHIRFRKNNVGDTFTDTFTDVVQVGPTPTTLTGLFTVPAGSTGVAVGVFFADQTVFGVGDTFDASDALIEIAPATGSYFDGSTPASGDFSYEWSGTPNASTSRQVAQGVAGVDSANPGHNSVALVQSSEWSKSGTHSMRLIPLGTGNDTAASVAGTPYSLSGQGVTLVPGTTYTVMATLHLSKKIEEPLQGLRNLTLFFTDSVKGWYSEPVAAQGVNEPGDQSLSITFTVDPSATWAEVRLYHGGEQGSGDVWWDSLRIYEGEPDGEGYFDKDTPDADPIHYRAEADGTVTKYIAPATSRTLYGLMVQVLPNGETPRADTFISGQGHSGCRFVGKPTQTAIGSAIDRVAMSAKLEEVGGWQ